MSKKHKSLINAAITASQLDREAIAIHITGALHAGAGEQELLKPAFTIIPVAGMPTFSVLLCNPAVAFWVAAALVLVGVFMLPPTRMMTSLTASRVDPAL